MTSTNRIRLLPAVGIIATGLCTIAGALFLWSQFGNGPGALTPVACPFESPTDTPVDCARLTVPAMRGDSAGLLPSGRRFSIFVTIVRATARTPEPDPVLVLGDAPGEAASTLAITRWAAWANLHQARDLIFVDLRGSGHSEPALTCPDLDPARVRFGGVTATDAEACAARIGQTGVDLTAFSSIDSAADLVDLRHRLGIKTWNLVASGYGAVVALELARADPDGSRGVIFDSPAAPRASPTDLVRLAAVQHVFRRVFADCKGQSACNHVFPNLDATFDELVQRLIAQPLPVVYTHPVTGARVTVTLDANTLLTLLTRVIGSGTEAVQIPALIGSLRDRALGAHQALPDTTDALFAAYWRVAPPVADGLAAAITCREIQPWIDVDSARDMVAMFRPFVLPETLNLDYQAFCPVWKLPRPPEDHDTEPMTVPALVLTGDDDTVTPSYQADAVAAAFSTTETIRIPNAGHGLLAVSGCARTAAAGFFEAPGRKIESTCTTVPPPFTTTPILVAAIPAPPPTVLPVAPVPPVSATPAPAAAPAKVTTAPAPVGPRMVAIAPPPLPPSPPPPPTPTAISVPCPFAIPNKARVDCGHVSVPEWHAAGEQAAGKVVTLFFAITRASGPAPLPDPVLVLNGGPGQAATDLIEPGWEQLAEIRLHRDILYVDQRGTGQSRPGLYCPEISPVAFWHGGLTATDAADCLKPIQAAGYNIAAFNTVESAADLMAVRTALGLSRWNLLGTSYGTALALELVRRDGAAIRSVVLNSPTSPGASWLATERMVAIRDVYRRLFADCAADAACNAAYPDLEPVFLDLARRMTDKPLPVTYQDPHTGATVRTQMSFATLLDILTIIVGSGTTAERVPALLWYLHQVILGQQPARPELLSWLYMPYWQTMNVIAYGLNAAIGCREVRPWIDANALRHEGMIYQPYVMPQAMEQDYDVFCPAWHLPPGPEDLRQPVTSAVPTLLLTGDYDTLTPTGLATIIASTLSKAQLYRFHAIGHDVFSASACARALAAQFIGAPTEPVSLPCLQTLRTPQFVAKRSF